MKIILLEDVANLGKLGDIVEVKSGYGRNFLIPYAKAMRATKTAVAEFEQKRSQYEERQTNMLNGAKQRYEKLNNQTYIIYAKSGVDGKLFGSVTALDIASTIASTSSMEIKKSEVTLPNGPLKNVGQFDVNVLLSHGIVASIKVDIRSEEKSAG